MNTMTREDYEALEGEKITVILHTKEKEAAIVANCDPDIGLTIVSANDKKRNLCCYVGPSSPDYDKMKWCFAVGFADAITQIKTGTYDMGKNNDIIHVLGGGGQMAECAFSQ